jgi:uncharacterized protein (TIGR03083 family)
VDDFEMQASFPSRQWSRAEITGCVIKDMDAVTTAATCHRAPTARYAELLEQEGEKFIAVTTQADPETPLPTCPGWTMSDLIDHVGGLHRWAEAHVRLLSSRRIRGKEIQLDTPEERGGYPDWLRAGLTRLIDTALAADPAAEVWAWGADKHARFWPRRMLFESVIHRVDAEMALDVDPLVAAEIALDGIDEFLDNLPHAAYFAPKVTELRGSGERVGFDAVDADVTWTIQLEDAGFHWNHERVDGRDVTVRATASDLVLFVYGRWSTTRPAISIKGDDALVARWVESSAI